MSKPRTLDVADYLFIFILGSFLLAALSSAFERWIEHDESKFAMQNGYEQVIDQDTKQPLWKKASQ